MKSILISIRPEFVAKILNGEKTIEIRKTAPKCELPVDVYIYCTKEGPFLQEELDDVDFTGRYDYPTGKYAILSNEGGVRYGKPLNGKVVAKFTFGLCDVISKDVSEYDGETVAKVVGHTCLSVDEIRKYANGGKIYVWEISDLVIFDEPKELWRFQKPGTHEQYLRVLEFERKDDLKLCEKYGFDPWDMREAGVVANGAELTEEAYKMGAYGLQRPPQSWQYVEVAE